MRGVVMKYKVDAYANKTLYHWIVDSKAVAYKAQEIYDALQKSLTCRPKSVGVQSKKSTKIKHLKKSADYLWAFLVYYLNNSNTRCRKYQQFKSIIYITSIKIMHCHKVFGFFNRCTQTKLFIIFT